MGEGDRELIDRFRSAAKYKSAGQISRETGIKLTTAKRLLGGGYPKGALKGEVREQVAAFLEAKPGHVPAMPTPPSDYLHTRMSLIDGQSTLTEWQRVLARDVEVAAILADAIREAERAATIRAGALRAAEDAAGERARAATAAEEAAVLRARSVAEEAADRRLREAYVPLPKEGDETQQKKRKTG